MSTTTHLRHDTHGELRGTDNTHAAVCYMRLRKTFDLPTAHEARGQDFWITVSSKKIRGGVHCVRFSDHYIRIVGAVGIESLHTGASLVLTRAGISPNGASFWVKVQYRKRTP